MTLTTGIERLRIRNFRVLRDVELAGLTPVTALIGPNGSGKSTVFDALSFLSESFRSGLAQAWDARNGIAEIGTRGSDGPVSFELDFRVGDASGQYRLVVEHEDDVPVVAEERFAWRPAGAEEAFDVLNFRRGRGTVYRSGGSEPVELAAPDLLAASAVSQFSANDEIIVFYRWVSGILISDLDLEAMRRGIKTNQVMRLSPSGRNAGVVIQRLRTRHPDQWAEIVASLRRYVPGFEDIKPMKLGDGALTLQLKEWGEDRLIAPDNISDGTLQLLGYLIALHTDTSVLLLEEPEKQVHPRLHYRLAEDARRSEAAGQVIIATHAPEFVDALRPDEVWMLFRDEAGFAQAKRAADIPQLMAMVDNGGLLGNLWTEGFFGLGDPLDRPGQPR